MATEMRTWAILMLFLAATPIAASGVKVRLNDEGLTEIYNETPTQHARRVAHSLVPVPAVELSRLIDRFAAENHLDPKLVRAVMQVESGYNASARSDKGAMGLMQLMPATASDLQISDPYDAAENVRAGTAYLRKMLDQFDGNLEYALAGYNAGPDAVVRYGGIPPYPETRAYVEHVLRLVRGDESFRLPPASLPGHKTYVSRDENGQLHITTAPPTSSR